MSFRALKWLGIALLLGAGMATCAARAQAPDTSQSVQRTSSPHQHVPKTPIDRKAAELGESTWNPQWNAIVEQALPPSLLSDEVPHDVKQFCPRFFLMGESSKRVFWAYFFQALAGAEAGLDPQAKVRHDEPKLARQEKVAPNKVLTEGLLQLTYADEQRYGCPFDHEADRALAPNDPRRTILQPKNNLVCGVTILTNQLIDQRKPLLSPSSYWATLRPGTLSYRVFAKQMTNPPPNCGRHRATKTPLRQVAQ